MDGYTIVKVLRVKFSLPDIDLIAHRAEAFAFDGIDSCPSTQGIARSASLAYENGPEMAAMRIIHRLEKDTEN